MDLISRPIRLHNPEHETPLYLCSFSGDVAAEQLARLGACLGKLPAVAEAYLCETNEQPNRPENADPILVLVVEREQGSVVSAYAEALIHRLFPDGPQFEMWITTPDSEVVNDVKKVSPPIDLFPEALTWRM
jgi:hypothetical protein